MKKNLFGGYNKSSVDEQLQTLINQNEALCRQNDFLEEELEALQKKLKDAQAQVAYGMSQADAANYKTLKAAYAALQENLRDTNKRCDELEHQLEQAKRELAALKGEN